MFYTRIHYCKECALFVFISVLFILHVLYPSHHFKDLYRYYEKINKNSFTKCIFMTLRKTEAVNSRYAFSAVNQFLLLPHFLCINYEQAWVHTHSEHQPCVKSFKIFIVLFDKNQKTEYSVVAKNGILPTKNKQFTSLIKHRVHLAVVCGWSLTPSFI